MQVTKTAFRCPTAMHIWVNQKSLSTLCLLLASPFLSAAQSAMNAGDPSIPPAEIIQRMVYQNEVRAAHLRYFTAQRYYHIDVHDLGRTLTADMHAQVTYIAATGKTFNVIDKSGSNLLINKVLLKLLDTERDDSQQKNSALTPANYNFVCQSQTVERGQTLYVFAVEPKVKNKLLYRGTVWIDAKDFAVVRVEAQPAENPSFWIRTTEIHQTYAKSEEFWLPRTNTSESKVRFGGTAVLTIDYGNYNFDEPHDENPTAVSSARP
jgi:hypothetical protein